MTRESGQETSLVLYEEGRLRNEHSRRLVTPKLAVQVKPGSNPAALAAGIPGLILKGPAPAGGGWYLYESSVTGGALEAAEKLSAQPGVDQALPQLARKRQKRWTPNDTLFSSQWHLQNTGQGSGTVGSDINVTNVWNNYRGAGIRIGIVDDGVQLTHPDLSPNLDTANDRNWNDGSINDPTPNPDQFDFHGTSCAGVAAGRGNNGKGISGAAPEATIVGLRLISLPQTDQDEQEAMLWQNGIIQIKSNSWGPYDDGETLEGPGPLMAAALENATRTGRGGLGTIFTWAGGNGGGDNDNSNYDGYANSIYTIAVTALDNRDKQSWYSEKGANLIVAAPSSGGTRDIVTTDLIGSEGYNDNTTTSDLADKAYTNDFGGTSSAAPLVAGCAALLLQSKPTLGWRDVQEIFLRSAAKCDPTEVDWINNGAGIHFNHNYGAGRINIQSAIALASTWSNLGPQLSEVSVQTNLNVPIPDNTTNGVVRTFAINRQLRVEHVTLKLNVQHTFRGQIEVTLTSPSGTISRLAERHNDGGDNYSNWVFMTVRNWGESAAGTWTLRVNDRANGTTGSLKGATLTLYGSNSNRAPVVTAAEVSASGAVFSDQTVSVSGVNVLDEEGDPYTVSYQWQESADGTRFRDISGMTGTSVSFTPEQAGKLVRCAVRAKDTQVGDAFYTATFSIKVSPPESAYLGQAFTYDAGLYLAPVAHPRSLLINEFSQGPSGNKDWVELLTLQPVDLRGYTLRDKQGTYVTFADLPLWSRVPVGTRIVIYNATDRDPGLPADDLNASDGVIVAPHNSTFAFGGAFAWNGLSPTAAESVSVMDEAGGLVDGVAFNADATQSPTVGSVVAAKAAHFVGGSSDDAEMAANWAVIASSAATPGQANGSNNTSLVNTLRESQFRLSSGSDTVPGLTLNPVSGVLSGTPAEIGIFDLTIERFRGATVVSQSFRLFVTDDTGNIRLGAGKSWTLNGDVEIDGDLTIEGSLDTAGHTLTVFGKLIVNGGSITNTTGTIRFTSRDGTLPPGHLILLGDAAHDVADDDGDGLENLLEFLLGNNPSRASNTQAPAVALVSSRLQMTVLMPANITGVTPIVEVSTDLITWQTGSGFTQVVSDTTTSGTRTLVVRSVSTTGPLFIRLRATR